MSYCCYTHNWSSRYEQCPSCATYKTTTSNNTCDVLFLNTPYEQSLNQIIADKNVIIEAAQAEIEVLKAKLEKCKEQRDIAIKGWFNSSDYRNGFAAARKIDESNKELDSIGSEK